MNKVLQITLLMLVSVAIAKAQWTQTAGPEGGKVVGIEVLSTTVYLATTAWGGVYQTADAGVSWTLPSTTLVGIEARGSAHLYSKVLVATPSGIYRSADSGGTWALANTGLSGVDATDVWVVKAVGSNFMIGTGDGVYTSTDNGLNWTYTSSGITVGKDVYDLSIDPVDNQRMLAAAENGLYQTIDGGANWSQVVVTGPTNPKFIKVTYGNTVDNVTTPTKTINYAAENEDANGSSTGVYYTKNDGSAWTLLTNGPTVIYNLDRIDSSTRGIAAASSSGIIEIKADETGWDTGGIAFANPNVIVFKQIGTSTSTLAGTGSGFFKGINFTSWIEKNNGLNAFNVTALWSSATGNLYAGTELGGVFVSADKGLTWNKSNEGIVDIGYGIKSFYENSTYLFAGTNHGVYRSADGGVNWLKLTGGTSGTPVMQFAAVGTTIYINELSTIKKSVDDGTTWTDATGTAGSNALPGIPIMLYSDGTNLYVGSFFGGKAVYRSTDGGDNWLAAETGMTNSGFNFATAFVNSGNNLLAATGEGFYKSTDAGANWTTAGAGLPTEGVVAFTENTDGLFATTDGAGIYVSADNGATFTAHNTALSNLKTGPIISGSLYAGTKGSGIWQEGVVYKQDQVITFNIPSLISFDTATYSLGAFSDSGLPVTLSIVSGPGSITNNKYTFETVGSVTIKGYQAGDATYNPAENQFTFTVEQGVTRITFKYFTNGTDTSAYNLPFKPDGYKFLAESNSDATITYAVDWTQSTAEGSVVGDTLFTTRVGSVHVIASQAANTNWNPAPDVIHGFNINQTGQTITFNAITDVTKAVPFLILDATASSGLPVSFYSIRGKSTISGDTLWISQGVQSGQEIVTALQSGDINYVSAADVSHTFCISPVAPTLSFVFNGNTFISSDNTFDGHEWFIDGVSKGSGYYTYEVTQAGTYKAIAVAEDTATCPASGFSNEVVVVITALVNELNQTGSIYPNPVHDRLTLKFANDVPDEITISVFSMDGRIKMSQSLRNNAQEYSLDMSGLQQGIYLVQVTGKQFNQQYKIKKH